MIPGFNREEVPFLRLLLPLITGIGLALHADSFSYSPWFTALLFLSFVLLLIFYRKSGLYRRKWIPGALIHLLLVSFGYTYTASFSGKANDDFSRVKHWDALMVKISSEPLIQGSIIRFESIVTGGFVTGKFRTASGKLLVLVTTAGRPQKRYRYGDLLLLPPKFSGIPPAFNPAEFDYSRLLAYRLIRYQGFFREEEIKKAAAGRGNPVIGYSLSLREQMVQKYSRYIDDKDAAALASALILGYRSALDQDIVADYSITGTTHVLSVSGMHVGIVFIVLLFLLKVMDRSTAWKIVRATLTIFLVTAYAIFTGLSSAVCRAAVMLIFVVIGKVVNREINSFNLLAVSAFLLLIYNPLFLADAGFQLSYLAMLGLFYMYPVIYGTFSPGSPLIDKVWSCVAVSTAAQLITFPVSMHYFHQFPVYFLLSNIFILLPVTIIMYLGILFLFIPWEPFLVILGSLLNYLILFMNKGLFYIGRLPGAAITDIWIRPIECLTIYLLIAAVTGLLAYKNKWALYPALSCVLILAGYHSMRTIGRATNRQVIFYSLRNHTAIGLQDGKRGYVITDLMQSDNTFIYSIKPSFSSSGINAIIRIGLSVDFLSPALLVSRNFIRFRKINLLVWDRSFNFKRYGRRAYADLILLTNNPRVKLAEMARQVKFRTLIIDSTNPDYAIEQWKQEAAMLSIPLYVLKKNPAYIISL